MPEHIKHIFSHNTDFLILILLGAAAHAAWQAKKAKHNKIPFTLIDALTTLLIAIFSGVVFGLVSVASGQEEINVLISVSVGAWFGITGLTLISKRFLGADSDDELSKDSSRDDEK